MNKLQELTEKQIEFISTLHDHVANDKDIKKLKTPEEIHFFVKYFNKDGQADILELIINNPMCDAGTALYIYYSFEPAYFYEEYASENDIKREYEQDIYRIIKNIENKFISGFYKNCTISYDPSYHFNDIDIKKLKQPIPAEMMKSTPGIPFESIDPFS